VDPVRLCINSKITETVLMASITLSSGYTARKEEFYWVQNPEAIFKLDSNGFV
jgi:hypothetical protein